jgi:hypothetical protein
MTIQTLKKQLSVKLLALALILLVFNNCRRDESFHPDSSQKVETRDEIQKVDIDVNGVATIQMKDGKKFKEDVKPSFKNDMLVSKNGEASDTSVKSLVIRLPLAVTKQSSGFSSMSSSENPGTEPPTPPGDSGGGTGGSGGGTGEICPPPTFFATVLLVAGVPSVTLDQYIKDACDYKVKATVMFVSASGGKVTFTVNFQYIRNLTSFYSAQITYTAFPH